MASVVPFLFGSFVFAEGVSTRSSITEQSSATVKTSPVSIKSSLSVGTEVGVAGKPFVLDGSKSQDDGAIRKFEWRQVSGPTASLSNRTALKPTFIPAIPGTYVFELIVIDADGSEAVEQKATFTVDAQGPTVKISTPQTGDPDFDLKATPRTPVDADGKDIGDDSLTDKESEIVGDPDFDLLNIEIDGDDIGELRGDASLSEPEREKKVTVRGWDPEKKEEIIAHPEKVKRSEDLKIYAEAVALNDAAIKGIKINKDSLQIESVEEGKLFGFIPVNMSSFVTLNFTASSSEAINVRLPWWNIFVKKTFKSGELKAELSGVFNPSKWGIDNSTVLNAGHVSQALGDVSNVLKTKHDTVKNSIGNIR